MDIVLRVLVLIAFCALIGLMFWRSTRPAKTHNPEKPGDINYQSYSGYPAGDNNAD